MPVLGLGTWQLQDEQAYSAVRSAIELGYRHIDCAWIYGNETEVGHAIRDCIQAGTVERDELWITSKLWNDRHRPEHVEDALKETLTSLGLEYLDLYLIHWPVAHQLGIARPEKNDDYLPLTEVPLADTWKAMIDVQANGLTRSIGVSNFSVKKIDQIVEATGNCPAFCQVESHPFLQQDQLFEYCNGHDIVFVCYSPLGSGGRPDAIKQQDAPNLFDDPVLKGIAEKHEISLGQVMLAWSVCRGSVPIPKSANSDRQKENMEAANIQLDDQDMQQIANVETSYRFVDGKFWEKNGTTYTAAGIWE